MWFLNSIPRLPAAVSQEPHWRAAAQLRIQQLERPGSRVPRIGEHLFAPSFSWAQQRAKSEFAIYASPRTSSTGGGDFVCNRSGRPRIVRALLVMSSPRVPSPRVTACTSEPFS